MILQNMSSAGGQLLGHEVAAIIRNNPLYSGNKQSLSFSSSPSSPSFFTFLSSMRVRIQGIA